MADPAIVIGSFADMFDTFAKQQAKFQSSIESLLKQNNAILEKNNQTFEYMNEAQERYLAGRPTNVQAPREVKEKENKVLIDGYTTQGKKEYKKLNVEPEPEATKPEEQKEGGILSTIFKFIGAGALGIAGVMGLKKLLSEDTIDKLKSFSQELTDKTNIRFLTSRLKKGFNEFLDKTVNGLFFGMKLALSALVENFQDYLPDFMKDAAYNVLYEDQSFSDVGKRISNYVSNLPIVKYFTNLYKAAVNLFGSDVYKKESLERFLRVLGFNADNKKALLDMFSFFDEKALDVAAFAGADTKNFTKFSDYFKDKIGSYIFEVLYYVEDVLKGVASYIGSYLQDYKDYLIYKYTPSFLKEDLNIDERSTRFLNLLRKDSDTDADLKKYISGAIAGRADDGDEEAQRIVDKINASNRIDLKESSPAYSEEEIDDLINSGKYTAFQLQEKLKITKARGESLMGMEAISKIQQDKINEFMAPKLTEEERDAIIQKAVNPNKEQNELIKEQTEVLKEFLKTQPEFKPPTPDQGNEDKNQSFFNVSPSQTINNDFSSTPTMEFFRQTALA